MNDQSAAILQWFDIFPFSFICFEGQFSLRATNKLIFTFLPLILATLQRVSQPIASFDHTFRKILWLV